MDLNDALRKIEKLLALAADERGDPNVAASAARQASKLMATFNLEHADVLAKTIERGEAEFAEEVSSANMKRDEKRKPLKKNPLWAGWLAVRVAQLNECQARYGWRAGPGAVVRFLGTRADVTVAKWMFDYLVGAMIAGCRRFQSGPITRTRAESDSYRKGFVLALCRALEEERKRRAGEMDSTVSGRALVVAKTAAVAAHFGPEQYQEERSVRASHGDAMRDGMRDGSRVDVARRAVGTNAGGSGALRLGSAA